MSLQIFMWPKELASQPESPATDTDITAFVESVFVPLNAGEINGLRGEHNWIVDPSEWQLPQCKLPESYLDFLRLSNGGFFAGVNRDFDPLFSTQEVRGYMLAYGIPHWMPLSCPIGLDGGGTFFLLDMRHESETHDYPVLFAHAGNLGYDDAAPLARTFTELVETHLGSS